MGLNPPAAKPAVALLLKILGTQNSSSTLSDFPSKLFFLFGASPLDQAPLLTM